MTYTLEKEELLNILQINNINCYNGSTDSPIDSFNESLHSSFMDSAIQLQPELEKINNDFIKKARDLNGLKKNSIQSGFALSELFAEVFDGKIKITSLNNCLFTSFGYVKNAQRKSLFLQLSKKSSEFLPKIYEEIEKNKNNDSCLYDSYFQILRNNKNNLLSLECEDILKSIKNIDTFFDVDLSKKKINTYISLFDKNQFLYDFIIKDMGDLLNKSALLNNYWESKLTEFEKGTVFKNEDIVLEFKEEASYFYSFEINKEWVIKNQKISDKQARLFCISFKRVMHEILTDSFDVNFVNKNINDSSIISMTIENKEQSIIIKKLFNNLVEYMPKLFETFKHKSDLSSQIEQMQQYVLNLNKYMLSKSLNEKLETKPAKSSKLKI